jgi:hypothetical protein
MGPLEFLLRLERVAAIIVRLSEARVGLDCLIEVADRLVEVDFLVDDGLVGTAV